MEILLVYSENTLNNAEETVRKHKEMRYVTLKNRLSTNGKTAGYH
jgi:hypothetical protein